MSRYASELAQAHPLFGFGKRGKGEYEAEVEAVYRQAKEMGLGVDVESIDAAIEKAKELVPAYRVLEKLMDEGQQFNQEYMEMLLLGSYKQIAARNHACGCGTPASAMV